MARILVAQDDPDIRVLIERNLLADQHRVESAQNGHAAIELIHGGFVPDVAVLDVGMPGMSGFELLELIRETEGVDEMLPCIFLTAMKDEETLAGTSTMNAFYMRKPYHADQLRLAISMALIDRSFSFE